LKIPRLPEFISLPNVIFSHSLQAFLNIRNHSTNAQCSLFESFLIFKKYQKSFIFTEKLQNPKNISMISQRNKEGLIFMINFFVSRYFNFKIFLYLQEEILRGN